MRIDGFGGIGNVPISPQTPGTGRTLSFQDLLQGSIGEVNRMQADAEQLTEAVMAGQDINPGVVAAAVTKADLAFRTMIQIRNKLTDALEELRQLRL